MRLSTRDDGTNRWTQGEKSKRTLEVAPAPDPAKGHRRATGWKRLAVAAFALCATAATTQAQLTINVGSITVTGGPGALGSDLNPTIQLNLNNPGSAVFIGGMDFAIKIAAGGPSISSVDLLTGTIFESNHTGPIPVSTTDHSQCYTLSRDLTLSPPQLPSGSSLIASVTLNTSGVSPGTYDLLLSSSDGQTAYYDAAGNPVGVNIANGSLTVVPEPEQYAAVAGIGLLVVAVARRLSLRRVNASCSRPTPAT
jgi:hypothetical protein